MDKKYITWREIFERIRNLDIDKEGNVIYGVPTGGMIITAFMKNADVIHNPKLADIILDDIYDSGRTAQRYLHEYPDKAFITLFDKRVEVINDWLVFPWEKDHPSGEDTIEGNIIRQLQYIGEDPNRPGLIDTPHRVVKMWKEVFRGYDSELKPKVSIFENGKDGVVYDQMIMDTGDFYSHCEHHMVPFIGKYWFGYIPSPGGGIIGLSKVARLVDYHAARLQIQERLVQDIVEDIWKELSDGFTPPLGMGLVMEAEHLCKTMRGARKKGKMTTSKLKGVFLSESIVRSEFLNQCK